MTEGHEDYLGDLWDLLPTDPTDFIEDTPTEDESEKAPSSEWAFDHNADVSRHHTKFTNTEHDLVARHPLAVLDPLVCSEAEAAGLIADHKALPNDHHVKYTDANARTAINDIFGADGKADANIDLDGNDLIGGDVIIPANGRVGVTDGNPQIVFDNVNNWIEITGKAGFGTATPDCAVDAFGTIRASGSETPSAGGGVEISYLNNIGYVTAYNRSTSVYEPLHFRGLGFYLKYQNAERFAVLNTEVVSNDPGNDVDFRVEGVGEANALFIQGSDGAVKMGSLAGVGVRNVVVDAAGNLSAP